MTQPHAEPLAATAPAVEANRFPLQQHYIDGAFRPSVAGGTFTTANPANGVVLAEASDGRAEDVDAAVAAARRAFDEGPWPRLSAEKRAAVLRRIAELIRVHADEFVEREVCDIGMPIAQMKRLAGRAAMNFEYYAGVVPELHGRAFQVGDEFLNYTIRKPVGVAGMIMPWNAPLMLSTWRIAPALAAGNTVVLKPAEWSPLTATLLAEVMAEAELPDGVFNVVQGFGETAGAPLSAHPGVDLLCFTGETSTGKLVIAAGAPTLKRSSVELGGKSPVVVFDDADPELAVDAAVAQIFTMNGQRCTAGSRLLVQRGLYDQVVEAVAERARNIRVGDPFDTRTELGPLIGPEHHERVLGYVQSARDEGARVLAGGNRPESLPDGCFLEATVIADVNEHMKVFQEEIFGPVLVAMPFDDEADAVRLANATPYGLAAYVWTNDIQRGHRVAHAIDTGMCWINSQNVRDLRTPFGGVKASGIGREGGDYAFDFYCELEIVHVALGTHRIPRLGLGDPD
ncbi:5-carboxymethyl-2-hydroxymuconate semialdehyde dehydrogenase [Conexibacter sp. CPCC 206217]|uniref:5-carboxymethyl-2-hydroxymuconate semialdehyde dehydrogenase n=1 Tax=Conexibacter sp. CPCC 206217 TaxID=3064574 RepID=UPI00272547C1|nr:5-carboxymethyl-2-hydroxymuconate semialdehyde dehydrogenase [Conexibacter sp. CPCC 206217]MDO8211175.1 5-carboxymethyl-2-hydroxymuconate semialdehyde dehydrogenase [Conexibacter sp. CPCC 206217]